MYAAGTVAYWLWSPPPSLGLIQAFNAVLGVAMGRVFTLAFLMFQLVSSGSVYPVETTAKPFQILAPYDPMTYADRGVSALTAGRAPAAVMKHASMRQRADTTDE